MSLRKKRNCRSIQMHLQCFLKKEFDKQRLTYFFIKRQTNYRKQFQMWAHCKQLMLYISKEEFEINISMCIYGYLYLWTNFLLSR